MLDTLDAADRAVVQQWITLMDDVTRLQARPCAYQVRGDRSIAVALDALVAQEHQMTELLRLVAREVLWRRDFPSTPLPPGCDRRADCFCRACGLARRAHVDRRAAVYDVQLEAVRRQRSSPDKGAGDEQLCDDDHVVL